MTEANETALLVSCQGSISGQTVIINRAWELCSQSDPTIATTRKFGQISFYNHFWCSGLNEFDCILFYSDDCSQTGSHKVSSQTSNFLLYNLWIPTDYGSDRANQLAPCKRNFIKCARTAVSCETAYH